MAKKKLLITLHYLSDKEVKRPSNLIEYMIRQNMKKYFSKKWRSTKLSLIETIETIDSSTTESYKVRDLINKLAVNSNLCSH